MKVLHLTLILTFLILLLTSCGGTGPEPPEELSFNTVSSVSYQDSVRIEWSTTIPSKGVIYYGLSQGTLDSTTADTAAFISQHSTTIANLTADTIYYFTISAWSEDGQTIQSGIDSFFTGIIDTLHITDIIVTPFQTEAAIEWNSTLQSLGKIFYGLSSSELNDSLMSTDSTLTHNDTLRLLVESTSYFYFIAAYSKDCQTDTSEIDSFTTLGDSALDIYGFSISGITGTGATVRWYTDREADSRVFYDSIPDAYGGSSMDSAFSLDHQLTLTELQPETYYFLRVISRDITYTMSDTLDTTFTTGSQLKLSLPDTTIEVGATFQYPVSMKNAVDLTAIEYYLWFNPVYLRALDVLEGPFSYDNNRSFFEIDLSDTAIGWIYNTVVWNMTYDEYNIPIDTQADGDGVLAYIQFQALSAGYSEIIIPPDSLLFFDLFSQEADGVADTGRVEVSSP